MGKQDEGLNLHLYEQDGGHHLSQLSEEDAQLVKELSEHYTLMRARNAHVLARAWERIQHEQYSSDWRSVHAGTFDPPLQKIERKAQMQAAEISLQKPGWLKRMVNGLVAAVLLTLLVGSMARVYSGLHAQTHSGSSRQGVQATATASYDQHIDGYVSPGAMTTNSDGSLNWPVGQSTYWASLRYHQLTGFWVSWTGNAYQWVAGAHTAGWNVSQTPHVPSIVILMPYAQGASSYGHVAVVESINANGSVHTSNMNWSPNGGGWDRVSLANFAVGAGVSFIWHS